MRFRDIVVVVISCREDDQLAVPGRPQQRRHGAVPAGGHRLFAAPFHAGFAAHHLGDHFVFYKCHVVRPAVRQPDDIAFGVSPYIWRDPPAVIDDAGCALNQLFTAVAITVIIQFGADNIRVESNAVHTCAISFSRRDTGYVRAVIAERHIILFIIREVITAVIQARQFTGEFRMGKNGVIDNADGYTFSGIASGIGEFGGNSLKPPLAIKLRGFPTVRYAQSTGILISGKRRMNG